MRRILTNAILVYWTAFFAVLAGICTLQLDHGIVEIYRLLGLTRITSTVADAGGVWLSAAFGVAFGVIALAFLWACVANVLKEGRVGDADEILRLAFASGAFCVAVLLVVAGMLSVSGVFPVMTGLLGALAASYVAAHMERAVGAYSAMEGPPSSARMMAARAAREYALRRFGSAAELQGGSR